MTSTKHYQDEGMCQTCEWGQCTAKVGCVAISNPAPEQEQRSDSEYLGEPVAWESLLGAIARGWCYEENANKTMDTELALAIAKEVACLFGIKENT